MVASAAERDRRDSQWPSALDHAAISLSPRGLQLLPGRLSLWRGKRICAELACPGHWSFSSRWRARTELRRSLPRRYVDVSFRCH